MTYNNQRDRYCQKYAFPLLVVMCVADKDEDERWTDKERDAFDKLASGKHEMRVLSTITVL